jgi:hypothetical protein
MMKLALASAALLGLTLAPAAYAQVSCSEVSRLNAEADTDFEDISGEETDVDLYQATYKISGARECMVDLEYDSIYSCEWQYSSYSDASSALSSQVSSLGYCLSGWSAPKSITPDSTADSDGYRSIAGTYWEGKGDFVDMEWMVELEEHADSNGTHYHLWVDLAYYWF